MSYGVGHRCGLDPALLWLWQRLAAAALIRPLAWEPLYAVSVPLKKQQQQKSGKHLDIDLRISLFYLIMKHIFKCSESGGTGESKVHLLPELSGACSWPCPGWTELSLPLFSSRPCFTRAVLGTPCASMFSSKCSLGFHLLREAFLDLPAIKCFPYHPVPTPRQGPGLKWCNKQRFPSLKGWILALLTSSYGTLEKFFDFGWCLGICEGDDDSIWLMGLLLRFEGETCTCLVDIILYCASALLCRCCRYMWRQGLCLLPYSCSSWNIGSTRCELMKLCMTTLFLWRLLKLFSYSIAEITIFKFLFPELFFIFYFFN